MKFYDFYLGIRGSHPKSWVLKQYKIPADDLKTAISRLLNRQVNSMDVGVQMIRIVYVYDLVNTRGRTIHQYKQVRKITDSEIFKEVFS